MLQYLIKWKGYPESDNTWEDANQIHAPDLIKLYHQDNPLQRIKGQLLSLQKPHLPTWLSSTSPSLHSQSTLLYPWIIRTRKSSLHPSSTQIHTRPISSTSLTLVGSETTPLGSIPSNTATSARRHTAATTLRLAWSHPLSYPVHPDRQHRMDHTSPHKSVLTPPFYHQSSIYVPSIDHNNCTHIPDPSKCHQTHLSICPTFRLPSLQLPFRSLVL